MRQTVDGGLLAQMIIHASASINIQKQHINELNVFPVPDGDTGTNMSLTMAAAAAELRKKSAATVADASSVTAAALLRGARGNSGVILSLLFRGFSKSLKEAEAMDGAAFAIALDFGVATAYKAVMKPTEGTILTVSRLAARRAAEAARENRSVEYVLQECIKEGQLALADTINQNPVLKKAGVVDAGGKGFLIILQGMLDCMRGLPIPEGTHDDTPQAAPRASFAAFETGEIRFSYCTEFICARESQKDPVVLRDLLDSLGDSLVLVDDDEIIKAHVHTNHPGKVLEEALSYGALLSVKVENMREQHTELLETSDEGHTLPPAAPEKPFGFVAVCAGEGLAAVFRDLGVDGIISGGQTMNPSTEDILCEINRTPAEVVYVFPNNKNIIMAAEQCVGLVEGKRVVVIPSRTVPQGISALLMMDPEADEQTNTQAMTEALSSVSTSEVTYAARDSEFGGVTIREGDYLALVDGQLFGTASALDQLLDSLAGQIATQGPQYITIYYGEDVSETDAQRVCARFAAACPDAEVTLLPGGQPVYYYMISAE